MKNNSEKNQAILLCCIVSVCKQVSLCMPFCGYILSICDGSCSQQKTQTNKKVKQKLSQKNQNCKFSTPILM